MWGDMTNQTVEYCSIDRAIVSLSKLCEPRIEPEIVVGLSKALPRNPSIADIVSCTKWIAPGYRNCWLDLSQLGLCFEWYDRLWWALWKINNRSKIRPSKKFRPEFEQFESNVIAWWKNNWKRSRSQSYRRKNLCSEVFAKRSCEKLGRSRTKIWRYSHDWNVNRRKPDFCLQSLDRRVPRFENNSFGNQV